MKYPSDWRFVVRVFMIQFFVFFIWQGLELLFYGTIQPRIVDDIMDLIWIGTLIWAYISGRNVIYDYEPDLIHADELRGRVWCWAEEVFADEPDNFKFNSLLNLIDESEVVNYK